MVARGIRHEARGRLILDGIDLDLEAGTLTVLAGPNGAGKSTLVRVLAGDYRATSGSVRILGRTIADYKPSELALARAVLPQEIRLDFAFSVRQVVEMGRYAHARRGATARAEDSVVVEKVLSDTRLSPLAHLPFPNLSAGEQALTMIARVLAQQTPVLLVDEPTASLDIRHQHRVMDLLRLRARRGVAVMAVLHDLNLAALYSDRVGIMSGGRLKAFGPPAYILRSDLLSDVYDYPIEVLDHPSGEGRLVTTSAGPDTARSRRAWGCKVSQMNNIRAPLYMWARQSRFSSPGYVWAAGASLVVAVTTAAVVVIVRTVDSTALARAFRELVERPGFSILGLAAFAGAFWIRSLVWKRVLPDLTAGHAWAAIHTALLGNHVLPFRLGESLRVVSVVRRAAIPVAEASASTITLRAADLLAVVGLAWILGARNISAFRSPLADGAVILVGAVGLLGLVWIWKLRRGNRVRRPGGLELAGTVAAWLAESGLVLVAARAAGIGLSPSEAVLVTALSVAAQVVAVAPGGFGTYEAGAVAAYLFLGYDPGVALAAALAAHALKTAYSIGVGIPALFLPRPGLPGRFRLSRPARTRPSKPAGSPDGPVVLFMPAHNEEASVGEVVRRVPDRVLGREVITLVIDDGSTDATARTARAAGAEVLSTAANRGLGAAVRTGLIRSLALDPAAVAFCDADAEYAPEEIGRLVAPILDGRADYVVGSRFSGNIEHMLPHRRLGNLALTRILAFVARTGITDGQSGYRAFSPEAAADAEIIHDFNYAQVITLDLIAKGFRYQEVPISYRFRTTGASFVRPGSYLRNVAPAVYRQLNGPSVAAVPDRAAHSGS